MFDLLASMYCSGQIDKTYLDKAVTLGWITQAQEDEIIAAGGDVGVLAVMVEAS